MKGKLNVDPAKLDWKAFLGSAPDQPFDAMRCTSWRWFWDFGGGHLTDRYSHYGDVVQWYKGQPAPLSAQSMGGRSAIPQFECSDTINTVWEYPGFHIVYNGALNGSLDGGNILFRGSRATLKINRDGSIDHVKNWLECIRARKPPNAGISSAVAIAKAAHMGNAAYRKKA
jgi:predicted dehydrogenase